MLLLWTSSPLSVLGNKAVNGNGLGEYTYIVNNITHFVLALLWCALWYFVKCHAWLVISVGVDLLGYVSNNIVNNMIHSNIYNRLGIGVSAAISACICGMLYFCHVWSACCFASPCTLVTSELATTSIGREALASEAETSCTKMMARKRTQSKSKQW